jgi:glycosyltransferase involved in cell wall biosynthesis
MSPDVTVVIPVLDRSIVTEAVASTLAQTDVAVEVVVVDDGSNDAIASLVDRIGDEHPTVRVVHQPNRGPSAARNAGVTAATAPFVTFLDSDDLMTADRLRRQLDAWHEAGGDAFVVGREEVQVAPGVQLPIHEVARIERGEQRYLTSMLLHRDQFGRVGGFDESFRLAEDVDMAVRLTDAGFRMIELDQIVVVRRIFGDNLVLDQAGVNAALFEVYRRRTRRMRGGQSSPAPDR